jgi:hypothetical protein
MQMDMKHPQNSQLWAGQPLSQPQEYPTLPLKEYIPQRQLCATPAAPESASTMIVQQQLWLRREQDNAHHQRLRNSWSKNHEAQQQVHRKDKNHGQQIQEQFARDQKEVADLAASMERPWIIGMDDDDDDYEVDGDNDFVKLSSTASSGLSPGMKAMTSATTTESYEAWSLGGPSKVGDGATDERTSRHEVGEFTAAHSVIVPVDDSSDDDFVDSSSFESPHSPVVAIN